MKRFLWIVPALGAALGVTLLAAACNSPAAASNGGGTNTKPPVSASEYPMVTKVNLLKTLFVLDDEITSADFEVWVQDDAESAERKLDPSKEEDKCSINGEESISAGRITYNGADAIRYGSQKINIGLLEDKTVSPKETDIIVLATTVEAGKQFTSVNVIRRQDQVNFDIGEGFNPTGLVAVAWYGGNEAGETSDSGGIPVKIDYSYDDTELKNAKRDSTVKVKIIAAGVEKGNVDHSVDVRAKAHKVEPVTEGGVTVAVPGAKNGEMQTNKPLVIKIRGDSGDFIFQEGSLNIEMFDAAGVSKGAYNEALLESAPDSGDIAKYTILMPRYDIKISAKAVRKTGALEYFGYRTFLDENAATGENAPANGLDNNNKVPGLPTGWTAVPSFDKDTADSTFQIPLDKNSGYIMVGAAAQLVGSAGAPESVIVNVLDEGGSPVPGDKTITNVTEAGKYAQLGFAVDKGGSATYKIQTDYNGNKRTYTFTVLRETDDGAIHYQYTGNYQTFVPSAQGFYKIQAWGADGGDDASDASVKGGEGGYVEGVIKLGTAETLYLYVGGQGGNSGDKGNASAVAGAGGWNGGGAGGESTNIAGAGGGGATSISLVKGAWNAPAVLAGRIMVAGGGGGASPSGKKGGAHNSIEAVTVPGVKGGPGGGLAGSSAWTQGASTVSGVRSYTAKQYGPYKGYTASGAAWGGDLPGAPTAPGQGKPAEGSDPTAFVNGQNFGTGGYGERGQAPVPSMGDGQNGKGGGGGGWWGGRVAIFTGDSNGYGAAAGGGGGSNYISGFPGCYRLTRITVEFSEQALTSRLEVIMNPDSKFEGVKTLYYDNGNAWPAKNSSGTDVDTTKLGKVDGLWTFEHMRMNPATSKDTGANGEAWEAQAFTDWNGTAGVAAKPAVAGGKRHGYIVIKSLGVSIPGEYDTAGTVAGKVRASVH